MARIRYGAIVSSASGSVGGCTLQRSAYGNTLRVKPVPIRSRKIPQLLRRSMMLFIQNSWTALSDAQRKQWKQFVSYSSQTILSDSNVLISGYNLYLKYQYCRLLYDLGLLVNFTYVPIPEFTAVAHIYVYEGSIFIAFDRNLLSEDYFFVLELSNAQQKSHSFSPSRTRFMKCPISSDVIFDITDSYLANFGVMPIDQSVLHFSIYYFSLVAPILSGYSTGKIIIDNITPDYFSTLTLTGLTNMIRCFFLNEVFFISTSNGYGIQFATTDGNMLVNTFSDKTAGYIVLISFIDPYYVFVLNPGHAHPAIASSNLSSFFSIEGSAAYTWSDYCQVYGHDYFISSSEPGTQIAQSTLENLFLISSLSSMGGYNEIMFFNNTIVIVGDPVSHSKIIINPANSYFRDADCGSLIGFSCCACSPSIAVAFNVGSDISHVWTSSDGNLWIQRSIPYVGKINRVIWTGSEFVAVGLFSPTNFVLRSTNGIMWYPEPTPINYEFCDIALGETNFIVISKFTPTILVHEI